MKKRILSLLMGLLILVGMLSAGTFSAAAASEMKTSQDCIDLLKKEEGFSEKPYWDYAQYTVGYGTACPEDMVDYYMEHGITEGEAEVLLQNHLTAYERDINTNIIDKYGLTLTQNQFDALIMFSYNCGTGWTYDSSGTFHTAIATGAEGNDLIRAFALWCSAGGEVKTALIRRRLCEVNMYVNGVYSQTPPDNYCYVLYDANGGETSPRSQGYDSDLTAAPFPVPTYDGFTFDGWYTEKNGGTKITVLDQSTKGMTLYAHWLDTEGKPPVVEEKEVTITVTGTDVNLRKGPGTNYAIVGKAQKGDQFLVTETASGSGYQWGKFDGGWICLKYTNYDTVIKEEESEPTEPEPTEPEPTEPNPTEPEPTEPKPTEPKPTEPEPTEPKPTEPKPTEPEPTEPKPTEPKPTEPEPTEPEEPKTVMGTVKVNEFLRVRSGPGTGYSVVEYLKPEDRVEILEQKTVGATVWGRISTGWISMDYVKLDEPKEPEKPTEPEKPVEPTPPQSVTGTVMVKEFLRIRSGPGTSYSVAGYLYPNDRVTITEQKKVGNVTWGKISNGWISMEYVKLDTVTQNPPAQSVTGTVKVEDFLRVRSGPGTSYAVAGYLKPNDRVTITEQKKVGNTVWGKISTGWISLDYVVLDKQDTSNNESTAVVKTVTADCLCVRSGAGTSNKIVGYLYAGAKVTILETTTVNGIQWGKISNGWICMDYVN